ncbi:MAG: hypothetical protein ACR2RL_16325 [Gammaproteobacteria bacterium]
MRAQTQQSIEGENDDAYVTALKLLESGQVEAALQALRVLAANRDFRAQGALANIHLEGLGVPRDPAKAMRWYCLLAYHREGGELIMTGIWRLAEYLRTGGGVPGHGYAERDAAREDPIRALFWFQVLAQQSRWYLDVDTSSQRIGSLGVRRLTDQLFPVELERVAAALEHFDPARPPPDSSCLKAPAGLDPVQ